jgi:hypothetical protein
LGEVGGSFHTGGSGKSFESRISELNFRGVFGAAEERGDAESDPARLQEGAGGPGGRGGTAAYELKASTIPNLEARLHSTFLTFKILLPPYSSIGAFLSHLKLIRENYKRSLRYLQSRHSSFIKSIKSPYLS